MTNYSQKVGFTGHIDVIEQNKEVFLQRLRNELKNIRKDSLGYIIMYNAMAPGADQWAAECLQEEDYLIILDCDNEDQEREYSQLNIKAEISHLVINSQNKGNKKDKYINIRDHLINHSTILIAAWDGIYNFEEGGTSDVVMKAIESGKPQQVCQFITPRMSNPYPVAAFLDDIVSFKDKKYNRFPFALHFSFLKLFLPVKNKEFRPEKRFFKDSVFWTYFLPLIMIVLTIGLGFIGFFYAYVDYDKGILNALFRAINLITFNHSVLENTIKVNVFLDLARILGLITVLSGAGYGFYIAFRRQRENVKLWYWRLFNSYQVILGLNEKSFNLVKNLQLSETKNVLIIDPFCEEKYTSELSLIPNVITKKKPITSSYQMQRAFIHESKNIFVFSDDESDVVRCVQEMDSLPISKQNFPQIYVQLYSEEARRFVHDSAGPEIRNKIVPFDINENTVRRLLMHYPIDRFYQTPDAKETVVFILGYGPLAQKLLDYIMRIGHYGDENKVTIKVFCEDAIKKQEEFYQKHPLAKITKEPKTNKGRVTEYTWKNTQLVFNEAPLSVYGYIMDFGIFSEDISKDKIVSIYALHPDGVQSAKLLNEILPVLDYLKNVNLCNLQVFCFYNFPDKNEEKKIEKLFNRLAPHTFVTLFGNFLDECTLEALQNSALDALPKLINATYANNGKIPADSTFIKNKWDDLKEEKKISNRMAADHLWAKIRYIWPLINWNIDMKTMIPNNFEDLKKAGCDEILGNLEHKRWCADLLMQNTKPFEYEPTNQIRKELSQKWNDKKSPFKKQMIDQRYHIDLVSYHDLHDDEKKKDKDQVINIPEFLMGIIKIPTE